MDELSVLIKSLHGHLDALYLLLYQNGISFDSSYRIIQIAGV